MKLLTERSWMENHETDLPLLEVQLRREALAEPPTGCVEQELVP